MCLKCLYWDNIGIIILWLWWVFIMIFLVPPQHLVPYAQCMVGVVALSITSLFHFLRNAAPLFFFFFFFPFSSPSLSLSHHWSSWIISSLNTKGYSQPPIVLGNGDNCLICDNCRALPCLVWLIAFEIHLVWELCGAKCYSRSGETSASKWNWLWKQTEPQPVEWPYVFHYN